MKELIDMIPEQFRIVIAALAGISLSVAVILLGRDMLKSLDEILDTERRGNDNDC